MFRGIPVLRGRRQEDTRVRRRLVRQGPFGTRALVVAAAVLTLGGFVAAYILSTPRARGPEGELVFAAAVTIPQGSPIVPQAVRMVRVRPGSVPAGAVRSPDRLAGRVARRTIPQGEVITENDLALPEEVFGISAALPGGRQAVTVVVPPPDAAMGRITPGTVVDVLATFPQPVPATRVLARGAIVLAVDKVRAEAGRTSQGASSGPAGQASGGGIEAIAVTLSVPEEAVAGIVLGQHAGRIALSVHARGARPGELRPEGASVAGLTRDLIPREEQRDRGEVGSAPRGAVRVPPPPSYGYVPVPPPPQLRTTPPPAVPRERAGGKAQAVREPRKRTAGQPAPSPSPSPSPVPPSQAPVEVIRGNRVRVEVVPVGDAPPTASSAATRTEAQQGREQVVVVQPQPASSPPPPPSPPPGSTAPQQPSTGGGYK